MAITSRRSSPSAACERAQVGEEARRPRLPSGRIASSWLMKRDQFVAGDAVLLRRPVAPAIRRLDGRAELLAGELRLVLARSAPWSSRNFRNMIQVSIGRRSRSPLSPLSLRMMSRADLMSAAELLGGGGAAVVRMRLRRLGVAMIECRYLLLTRRTSRSCKLVDGLDAACSAPPNSSAISIDVAVRRDRRNLQHVGQDELRDAVLARTCRAVRRGSAAPPGRSWSKKSFAPAAALRALAAGAQRRVEGEVAEQVERVGVGLLGRLGQLVEVDAALCQRAR